jgi:hypothetical protein
MKSRTFLPTVAFLLILTPLGAEELLPPVPEGLDGPPPIDSNEPLPSLQDFDKFLPGADPTQTDLEPGPAKPEAALQAIEKALPTATPVAQTPTKALALPTPTIRPAAPTPSPVASAPTDQQVPMTSEKQKPAAAPSGAAPSGTMPNKPATAPGAASAPAAPVVPSSGALTDYFPVQTGMKWTYEYLKGGAAKKVRSVGCTQAETFPNGTVRATLQVTEDAAVIETYSLLNGAVQRTGLGGQTLEGEYAFKMPKKGLPSTWTNGTKTFTASFGKAQVYQKVYPDCVVVKEKDGALTTFTYYAKGIGLVALEVYGVGLKLDQTRSYALTAAPLK